MARGPNGGEYPGDKVPLTGRVNETLAALVRETAERRGITVSTFLEFACNEYLIRFKNIEHHRRRRSLSVVTRAQVTHALNVIEREVNAASVGRSYFCSSVLGVIAHTRAFLAVDRRRRTKKLSHRKIVLK